MMKHSAINSFLCSAVLLATALLLPQAEAQDAKSLFEQYKVEGNSCKKVVLACQAAAADKKNKDYQEACDRGRAATNTSDERFRLRAMDALSNSQYGKAQMLANSAICNADIKASILSQVADAQKGSAPATPAAPAAKADQSAALFGEATSALAEGKLDAAVAAARQVTDPNLKRPADDIIGKVNAYRSAVSAAKASEASKDYAGALSSWHAAQNAIPNGPDSPGANISRVEGLQRAASTPATAPAAPTQAAANHPATPPPTPANTKGNQPPPAKVDPAVQVAKLLDDATKAVAANQLQLALRSYESVLHLQPDNTIAQAGKADIQKKINSDPAEQAKTLAQAIRDFYGSKFTDAEDALRAYLDVPTAKSKGAAYFYLGATRLNSKILSSSSQKVDAVIASSEVQRPFKDARAAGYQPLTRFVSPVVMRAWQSVQ